MHFEVFGTENQCKILMQPFPNVTWKSVARAEDFSTAADAYFLLSGPLPNQLPSQVPLFFNEIIHPLSADNELNIWRFNGWPGFLEQSSWEVAGSPNHAVQQVLSAIGKTIISAPDTPGLIAPRIISMIINEAYFALGEGVSSKAEIDIAMKLGTNYPFGPFEWAEKIGIQSVFQLLNTLALHDERCTPAPLLIKEANT